MGVKRVRCGSLVSRAAVVALCSAFLFAAGVAWGGVTYTWKADANGNWSGNWGDTNHWVLADAPADTLPTTSDTAVFPTDHAIVVTIDDDYKVGTLDLSRSDGTLDLTLRGSDEYGTNKMLTVSSKLSMEALGGQFVLDRAALKISGDAYIGCQRLFDVKNGSFFYTYASLYSRAGGTFQLRGDSYAYINLNYKQENAGSTCIIDDSTLFMNYNFGICTANVSTESGPVRFRGTHPVLRFAQGKAIEYRANGAYTASIIFEVPIGGYVVAPIQTVKGTVDFPQYYGANFLKFEIDPASPCYSCVETFTTPLVSWPGTTCILTTGKIIYGDLPDGGTFLYGTSAMADYGWSSVTNFSGTALALGVTIVSKAHNDRLTVATDAGVTIEGLTPAEGEHVQSEIAEGSAITFSSPASVEVSGIRYTCKGYSLTEVEKTENGSVTNVTTGTASSLSYTVAGREAFLIWHYAQEYKVTTSVVNDANGSVTITEGTGYIGDEKPTTLTAATTSDDMEFQYWYGDIPYDQRYANPLTLKGAQAKSITAFFGRKAGGTMLAKAGDTSNAKSWFASATWSGGVIPGTNDTAVVCWTGSNGNATYRFKVDVPSFFAVKNLDISNACVRVNANGVPQDSIDMGARMSTSAGTAVSTVVDQNRKEAIGCDIGGNLTIDSYNASWNNACNGGYLLVGGRLQQCPSKVTVGGDLTLANGSLAIVAGHVFSTVIIDPSKGIDGPNGVLAFNEPQQFFRGDNVLRVKGQTMLNTPTIAYAAHRNVLQTVNEFRTGVAVWLDLQDVDVQANAAITSGYGGYAKFNAKGEAKGRTYSTCPGGHCLNDNTSGGSYGGSGGSEDATYPTQKATAHVSTYGFANAPYYPGSPNGGGGGIDCPGAGSIRLDCKKLTLEGSLCAEGLIASGNKGGSSGGGIWVVCDEFVPAADCLVTAAGGLATGNNSGGGGGRVSICEGLTAEQVEELFLSEDHEATDISVSSLADKMGSRFSVAGGTGTTSRSNGYDGTGVYIVNTTGKKTLVVAGDPENLGVPTPEYGTQVVQEGTTLELEAPSDAYVTDDNRSRRSCVGYTITDEFGTLLVDSDKTKGSYTITTDCTLTWKLTSLVHKIEVVATVGGSVTTNQISTADDPWQPDGSTVSLTAVPQAGFAFAGWFGELPSNSQANETLVFTSTQGRSVKALFVTTATGAAEWTGAGDGTSWEDAANWNIAAIPGASNDVTIPDGANVTAPFCLPVCVKSLTIEEGATLTFGPNGSYSTYKTPRIAENAKETDWQCIKLTVANNLVVNGTFAIGGKFSLAKFDLAVGGELVFGEGARGDFYAAFNADQAFLDTPTLRYGTNQADMARAAASCVGGQVTVGGLFSVATNAVVSPWCDFVSGASVRFDVGSLLVSQGGTIDAVGKGWGYVTYSDLTYSFSPTIGDGNLLGYGGGTHAGIGGYSETHTPSFMTYGWAYAPLLPGGPGFNTSQAIGGGVVRIHARGGLRCYGTITANGGLSNQAGSSPYCGAGGSVFLTGSRFKTCDTTVVTADGASEPATVNTGNGAGGGGRIAIGLSLSDADLAALCETGMVRSIASGKVTATVIDPLALPMGWAGTITAQGGTNSYSNAKYPGRVYSGEDGTAYLLQGARAGLVLIVR